MASTIGTRLLEAWGLAAVLQLSLWAIAQRTKNAAVVDVGWASSFALIVALWAWRTPTPAAAWAPIAIVVAAWSLRLAGYLVSRGAALGAEEGRYAELRRTWSPNAGRTFLLFFQAQALLAAALASAFVVPFVTSPSLPGLRWAGVAVAAIGVIGETVADAQLARFKRTAQRGDVCDRGLWSYSRHPNYFFEWCFWIGLALYGLAFAPLGLIALLGQAIILGSILLVTGIPPTEAQALRSKGEAYRDYQRRVSRFIPLPQKRSRPSA